MFELNQRFTITTPQGMISEAGIRELMMVINSQRPASSDIWQAANPGISRTYLPTLPSTWDWQWVVSGRAEFAGTFPKRVSNFYFKRHGIRCPEQFIAELGNIARRHSENNAVYHVQFTDDLDWEAGDFGDDSSCFWGDRWGALEMLRDNGALAVQFFNDNGEGYARAWVAANTPNDDQCIVFNGYGIEGNATLTIARVVAFFLNRSYRKIELDNAGGTTGLLWVNDGAGYLIGAAADIEDVQAYDLGWTEPYSYLCHECGDGIHEDAAYFGADDHAYCERCFDRLFERCDHCGESIWRDDAHYTDDAILCSRCFDRQYTYCDHCNEVVHFNDARTHEGETLCPSCYEDASAPPDVE